MFTAAEIFNQIKNGEINYTVTKKTKNFVFYVVGETTIRVHVSEAI